MSTVVIVFVLLQYSLFDDCRLCSDLLCLLVCTQPAKLMDTVMSCAQLEDAVEEERHHLSSVEVDIEDVEGFKQQLKGLLLHLSY